MEDHRCHRYTATGLHISFRDVAIVVVPVSISGVMSKKITFLYCLGSGCLSYHDGTVNPILIQAHFLITATYVMFNIYLNIFSYYRTNIFCINLVMVPNEYLYIFFENINNRFTGTY